MSENTAFHDLPAKAFPFTMRAYLVSSDALVWEERMEGPGVLQIPALAKIHGGPVYIEVEYPDGRIERSDP